MNGYNNKIPVMHLIDALNAGGAERVCVNLVNLLQRKHYIPFLCTTRGDGALESLVFEDVGRLCMERKYVFDWKALRRLVFFIRKHNIKILHAHSTSIFVAVIASLFRPHPLIIWHDHYGPQFMKGRKTLFYRCFRSRISAVFSVSSPLAEWAKRRLHFPAEHVWYIPNFVCEYVPKTQPAKLPGEIGKRIVCTSNFHPPKDHVTLIRAMNKVIKEDPNAHLIMVGAPFNSSYFGDLQKEIIKNRLDRNVTIFGPREDVFPIIRNCDIGVLSSKAEGFPLTLLEFGIVKLPVIATRVGQCAEILNDGRAGILVNPGDSGLLANALTNLLKSSEQRKNLGNEIFERINKKYSSRLIISQISQIYGSLLHQKGYH